MFFNVLLRKVIEIFFSQLLKLSFIHPLGLRLFLPRFRVLIFPLLVKVLAAVTPGHEILHFFIVLHLLGLPFGL
jgi:hypothetical protein